MNLQVVRNKGAEGVDRMQNRGRQCVRGFYCGNTARRKPVTIAGKRHTE